MLQTAWKAVRSWRWWAPRDGMLLQEALALLRGEVYIAPKRSVLNKIIRAEKWFRSDRSLCESLPPVLVRRPS